LNHRNKTLYGYTKAVYYSYMNERGRIKKRKTRPTMQKFT